MSSGVQLIFPPNSLSANTRLTATVFTSLPVNLPNPAYIPQGPAVTIDLGTAQLLGEITISLPLSQPSSQILLEGLNPVRKQQSNSDDIFAVLHDGTSFFIPDSSITDGQISIDVDNLTFATDEIHSSRLQIAQRARTVITVGAVLRIINRLFAQPPKFYLWNGSAWTDFGGFSSEVKSGRSNAYVLIHGFLQCKHAWSEIPSGGLGPVSLASQLQGTGEVVALDYPDTPDFRVAGDVLSAKLSEEFGNRQVSVTVIAHSMGGLVARWAIERRGASRYIGRLVTLGTPHDGTPCASRSIVVRILSGLARAFPTPSPCGDNWLLHNVSPRDVNRLTPPNSGLDRDRAIEALNSGDNFDSVSLQEVEYFAAGGNNSNHEGFNVLCPQGVFGSVSNDSIVPILSAEFPGLRSEPMGPSRVHLGPTFSLNHSDLIRDQTQAIPWILSTAASGMGNIGGVIESHVLRRGKARN